MANYGIDDQIHFISKLINEMRHCKETVVRRGKTPMLEDIKRSLEYARELNKLLDESATVRKAHVEVYHG